MADTDFNLVEEYGWFLDGIVQYVDDNPEEFIEHFGVKGMKWGVRKGGTPYVAPTGLGPNSVTAKTKSGETITMTKSPPPAIARALSRISPNYKDGVNRFANLTITDSKGKKIGDASVHKESKDELNLVWLGIDKSARGRGYATAAMKTAVKFGQEAGFKKLTLEVPGNAPDARHIYEKLGFKFVKDLPTEDGDIWGGLTVMEHKIAPKVRHSDDIDPAERVVGDFLEHYGVKGMKWGQVRTRAQIDSDSADVAAVKEAKTKIKSNRTTDVLSNKELQNVVTRMNLEQQYNRLTNEGKKRSPLVQKQLDDGKAAVFKMAMQYGEDKITDHIARKNPAAGIILKTLLEAKRGNQSKKKGNNSKKNDDEGDD